MRHAGGGPIGARFAGVPGLDDRLPERSYAERQIGNETPVRPASAVIGHSRRHLQTTAHQRERKIVQQRAVVEQMVAAAAGTVAGELPLLKNQVAGAAADDARRQALQRRSQRAEHMTVGLAECASAAVTDS